jgi:hypothetical protein
VATWPGIGLNQGNPVFFREQPGCGKAGNTRPDDGDVASFQGFFLSVKGLTIPNRMRIR